MQAPHQSDTATPPTGGNQRFLRFAGHRYPLELPTVRDPRLHLAAVIISLQILGQTVLGFELSVAQILVSVLTCALIEVGIGFVRRRAIIWPASALLTGNGVAFILRVNGTRHGDWWSLRGAWIFAAVAAFSLLSKYVIRIKGRHIFNPSNVGLVAAFVVLGTQRVNPQDLWWGSMSAAIAVTLVVIVGGGFALLSRLRMMPIAIVFWLVFAAGIAVVAAGGHCMSARWHLGPVCGKSFWWVLVSSPEILVFLFFMITDPKTAPQGRIARIVYAATVAIVAAILVAPQRTEFATKVAVLGGLAVVCACVPLMERLFPAAGSERDTLRATRPTPRTVGIVVAASVGGFGLLSGALLAAGVPARPSRLEAVPAPPPPAQSTVAPVPRVAIDHLVRGLDASITAAKAAKIARDFAEDLAIIADAVRLRDAQRARTVATGPVLDRILSLIAGHGVAGVSTYRFDRLTLIVVRDPKRPQGTPLLGFKAAGTATLIRYDAAGMRVGVPRTQLVDQTFVVVQRGRRFILG